MEFKPDPAPIRQRDGVLFVAESRVPLVLLVDLFADGLTPAAIIETLDALSLAEVYAAVGYYLNHRERIDELLLVEEGRAAELRRTIEEDPAQDASTLRATLLARKAAMAADASPSR